MAKQPYLALYTGDWKKDPELSLCSDATRGIWIDLLCSIHDGRIGQVTGTPEQLARLCRSNAASVTAALHDLQANKAANVSERDGVFTIVCRRMKRAAEISQIRAQSGAKGGAKSKQRESRPDTDNDNDCLCVIGEYCSSLGLPKSDAEAVFAKWQGNGWTNRGEPIRDWKATIRSWKLQGYMPSQRLSMNGQLPSKPMSAFEIEKRVNAINDRINALYRADKEGNRAEIDQLKVAKEKA